MRTETRPRTQAARLSLLLVAGLLVGCSDPGQPSTTLPTAASTTTSATSSAGALAPLGPEGFPVPDEARQQTPDGAVAMAEYWLALSDYLEANPGTVPAAATGPLRDLSSPDCQFCAELADSIDAVAAASQRSTGGELSLQDVSASGNDTDVSMSFIVNQQPYQLFAADGQPVPGRNTPAKQFNGGMDLRWDGARAVWIPTTIVADPL